MSESTDNAAAVRPRRMIVRAVLLVLYVALGIVVFVNGRTHTFLIDNKSSEDGSSAAFRRVTVYIDNHPPLDLYARDRELLMVRGQTHRIRIETQEGTERLEARFSVPFGDDMILLSVPRMAAGDDGFWEKFVINYVRPTNNDAPESPEDAPVSMEPTL